MSESIGIMDEGYFVPRGEILKWINQILKLDLTMIEQLGSGAVYCQLLDAVCPGIVPLHKINWRARTEYDFIQNLKVLQFVFDRVGMTKKLDVRFDATLDHEARQGQVPGQPRVHTVDEEVHRNTGRMQARLRRIGQARQSSNRFLLRQTRTQIKSQANYIDRQSAAQSLGLPQKL
jgi:hypothetical protein